MSRKIYLAKPNESYEDHVLKCYKVWKAFIKVNEENLFHFSSKYQISYEALRHMSLLTVLFHDIGKLSFIFQEQMDIINKGGKPDYSKGFRHEILSAMFVLLLCQEKQKGEKDIFPDIEMFVVLGHHKSLDPQWSSFSREKNYQFKECLITSTEIKYALNVVEEILICENIFIEEKTITCFQKDNYKKQFFSIIGQLPIASKVKRYKSGINSEDYRQVYSLLKGILCYCDWQASSEREVVLNVSIGSKDLIEKIKNKLVKENKKFEIRPFNEECISAKEDILVIAPTGSGKTEAALFWALNQKYKRIIILMPTMVTSNSLYERISENYINKDLCGITHSGAQTYIALHDDFQNKDPSEIREQLLYYKVFIPPVMISTVDQILSTGFNVGYWYFKEKALMGSAVIFDEIHAYDSHALALITETIKKIKKLNGRIMLMSATMPQALRKHFKNIIPSLQEIVAEERMSLARNTWQYIDKSIEEIRGEIQKYLNAKKTVAIVVNDIETAKREFDYWKDQVSVMCYHSEFIMQDRLKKEKILMGSKENRPQLLIATQTIEVSLDVSFDIMFSECAPFDSLIQRAGRCNRYNKKGDYKFIVFSYSEIAYKKIYKKSKGIMDKTLQVVKENQKKLSEKDLSLMLEKVYENHEIYNDAYKVGEKIYREIAEEEVFFDVPLSEAKTRNFDYVKVSIIPWEFKENVEELVEKKQFYKIPLFELPVGMGKYHKLRKAHRQVDNRYKLPLFNVKYSSDSGIDVEELDETCEFC